MHVNAGAGALALVIVLGKRRGWPQHPMPPHSLPLTLLGTGILWFGWFGFNAGSALGANLVAAQAFMNTFVAAAAAMIGWLDRRADQDRPRDDPGCRVRCRRRPRRDHAVRGVRRRRCRRSSSASIAGVGLLPRDQPEVQVRLRRLARRHRRAPRRRAHRVDPARALRRRGGEPGGQGRRVLRRRLGPVRRAGARGRRRARVLVRRVAASSGSCSKVALPKGSASPRKTRTTGLDLTQHSETGYALERV